MNAQGGGLLHVYMFHTCMQCTCIGTIRRPIYIKIKSIRINGGKTHMGVHVWKLYDTSWDPYDYVPVMEQFTHYIIEAARSMHDCEPAWLLIACGYLCWKQVINWQLLCMEFRGQNSMTHKYWLSNPLTPKYWLSLIKTGLSTRKNEFSLTKHNYCQLHYKNCKSPRLDYSANNNCQKHKVDLKFT